MGCSSLVKGVDVRRITKIAYAVGSSQFLEDEGNGGGVVDVALVVRSPDCLHCLPKVSDIVVLGCQVNVGNGDDGDFGSRDT